MDMVRAAHTSAALLGFRFVAASAEEPARTIAVVPFAPGQDSTAGYFVLSLPDIEGLQLSVLPIVDLTRPHVPDDALTDRITLSTNADSTAPAERTVWSIIAEDGEGALEIRGEHDRASDHRVSGLYLSERHGAAVFPARSLAGGTGAHRLQVRVSHRFDPEWREDLYEVVVSPDPRRHLAVPVTLRMDTILAAAEACKYLENGPQFRQEPSLNLQECVLDPDGSECRFAIPGPVVDYLGEQRQGHTLGFLDRILLWSDPPCTFEFMTADQESATPQSDGMLLLVSLGGRNLRTDTGKLRRIMQDLVGSDASPRPDHWYPSLPSLGRYLSASDQNPCTAIAEFAFAVCVRDLSAAIGSMTVERLRPASIRDYAATAPVYELLRHAPFDAVVSNLSAVSGPLSTRDRALELLFELGAAALKQYVSPRPNRDASGHDGITQAADHWLGAFHDLPWDLIQLSLYPEVADAIHLGIWPDTDDYSDFASRFLDHRQDAERYQHTRSRLEGWLGMRMGELAPALPLDRLAAANATAARLEHHLVEAIVAAGRRVGVRAEMTVVSGQLPAFPDGLTAPGPTAMAAQTLFQRQIRQAQGDAPAAGALDGPALAPRVAEFLVAMIDEDCRFVDRAVSALDVTNPAMVQAEPAPALAGVAEPRLAYRPAPSLLDPDLAAWLAEPTSLHPIIEQWREAIKAQIG
ncbi:MAG: hypothetical protein KDC18_09115 [Alphaproteobacteria bacterium]|nr:hypothetical protein [Alphaproteobacteria bacterium]